MLVTPSLKNDLFTKYSFKKTAKDTGSPEGQIAWFSHRINHINDHLKTHKKDCSSQLGLIRLVGQRKKLLLYLKNKAINRYRAICTNLSLRK